MTTETQSGSAGQRSSVAEVFLVFLRLGLTSFGGPVAHLGYFREEEVARRAWLDERAYADLVALCQFLPGPASSQVGMAVGLSRAGYAGALAAWTAFTLPSAIALVLFAYGVGAIGGEARSSWLHGLKIAAVAVVAQAVLGMMRSLAPDKKRATIAVIAAIIALSVPLGTGWRNRTWRDCRLFTAAKYRHSHGPDGHAAHGRAHGGHRLIACLLRTSDRPPDPSSRNERQVDQTHRLLLPLRLARVRWRSCGPALAAGRGRAARLGQQRSVPRRLRRGTGRTGTAFHLRGLIWARSSAARASPRYAS